ncbi:MAG: NAD(P)/FAD-dependent oxidoreductase [Nitrospirales bacterium]|nr:NAD(P)/FAD-dependent oxidoreductase [Nitrospirales bacterium]
MTPPLHSFQYDVIVVGMGPAGASTAYELSRLGMSVVAFDKQVHPRYKICGGGLSARIERILPADFKAIIEGTVYRVQFIYGGTDSFIVESPRPVAYMVMRQTFDQWLVEKAREAGVEIREEESVVAIQELEDGVEVATGKGRYRGRVVIGADGAMSVVAQQCFPGREVGNIPALESEYHGDTPHAFQRSQTVLISLRAAKKGYGWVFPKEKGLSLGVGEFIRGRNRPKRSFEDFINHESALAGLAIPSPLGHPLPIAHHPAFRPGHRWTGSLVRHRAVLVGDAGHLVDPLLGEGIYYAVRSGQLAAASVASSIRDPRHRLEEYEKSAEAEFALEFRVASRLGAIIYGLPRSCHWWAGRTFPDAYQRVLGRYCELLQGTETYQTLWAKILQRLKRPFGCS